MAKKLKVKLFRASVKEDFNIEECEYLVTAIPHLIELHSITIITELHILLNYLMFVQFLVLYEWTLINLVSKFKLLNWRLINA